MKFGGQTSKKFYEIRKVFLETTLCVYVYLVKFYVFIFDETYMVSPKLVYKHIWDENVGVRHHLGPKWGPRGGPKHWSSTLPSSGTRRPKQWKVNMEMARRWFMSMDTLFLKVGELQMQSTRPPSTEHG